MTAKSNRGQRGRVPFWDRLEWEQADQTSFLKLFDDTGLQALTTYVEMQFRVELMRIFQRLSARGDLFFTTRLKTRSSAFNKLRELVRTDFEKTPLKDDKTGKYRLWGVIRDLIGARIVCVDADTWQHVLVKLMTSETIRIDAESIENYDSDFGEPDISLRSLERLVPSLLLGRKTKDSHYESVHFYARLSSPTELRGLPPMHGAPSQRPSRFEPSNEVLSISHQSDRALQIFNLIPSSLKPFVAEMPVEVQLRTFSEHIWAHDEHKFYYSPKKLGKFVHLDDTLLRQLRELFSLLKYQLNNVDQLQHRIRSWNTEKLPVTAWQDESFHLTSRMHFFKDSEHEPYIPMLQKIDDEISELISSNELVPSSYASSIVEIMDRMITVLRLHKKNTREDLLEFYPDQFDTERWGRQRVVLLALGYMLVFGVDVAIRGELLEILERGNLDALLPMTKYLRREDADGKITTSILALRIYEYIHNNDRYANQRPSGNEEGRRISNNDEGHRLFFDPLVFSRFATACYKVGDFSKAMDLGQELLGSNFDWERTKMLSHRRGDFVGRLIEYAWFDSYSKGYNSLVNNIMLLQQLATEIKRLGDIGDHGDDYIKGCSWMITIYHFLVSNAVIVPREFAQLVTGFETHIKSRFSELDGKEPWPKKVYFLLGTAICLARDGRFRDATRQLEMALRQLVLGIPHPKQAIEIYHDMCRDFLWEIAEAKKEAAGKELNAIFILHHRADRAMHAKLVEEASALRLKLFEATISGPILTVAPDDLDAARYTAYGVLFLASEQALGTVSRLECQKFYQSLKRTFPKLTSVVALMGVEQLNAEKFLPPELQTQYVPVHARNAAVAGQLIDLVTGKTTEGTREA